MASNLDFVQYVCNQIDEAGTISYRKMFGEYGIYCDGKVIGVIYENQFFVKKTEAGVNILPNCEESPPYKGAKPHLIVDSMDNRKLMVDFIRATCKEIPAPKHKKEIACTNYNTRGKSEV